MGNKRKYQIISILMAGIMTFSAVDMSVMAANTEISTEESIDQITFDEITSDELASEEIMLEENVSGDDTSTEGQMQETVSEELENIHENETEFVETTMVHTPETQVLQETLIPQEAEAVVETNTAESIETEPPFTVAFDANGGELANIENTDYMYEDYDILPVPYREGYQFEGWFTERENGQLVTDLTALELGTNVVLYAHWILKEVCAPVADIENGSLINQDTIIRLSSRTPDALIYYTIDGTDPLSDDAKDHIMLYTDGINAGKVMTDSGDDTKPWKIVIIKAYAVKEGSIDSEVVSFEYTVEDESSRWGDIIEADRSMYATENHPDGDASLVPEGMWVAGINEAGYMYCGKNITFDTDKENAIRVYDGKKLLTINKDYTVKYKNNKNAYTLREGDKGYLASKAPTIIMTGKGNYTGNITKTFIINPIDLSMKYESGDPAFVADDISVSYNGKVQKGTTKVTFTDETGKTTALKAGKDFDYQYPGTDEKSVDYDASAFKEARDIPYTVVVQGKGNYTGTITFEQKITKFIPISKVKKTSIPAQKYQNGAEIKPVLTLKYGGRTLTEYDEATRQGDYVLQYRNNINPGTARVIITGKGEYQGTCTVTFKINGYNLKNAKIEKFESSCIYTGDEILQDKAVLWCTTEDGQRLNLEENKHYTSTYTNNKNVGTATVVYSGKKNSGWTGTIKKTYKIKAYDLNTDTEKRITVTDSEGNTYPQRLCYVKGGVKPSLVIKYTSPEGQEYILREGTDYKLSYLNNKLLYDGAANQKVPVIKITGKGNFKGARQKEKFRIVRSDISCLDVIAKDKLYKDKKGNYTTSVEITDIDGNKLKAGTDYEKELKYLYYDNVILADGTKRESGTEVGANDIVPAGTVLEVVVTGKGMYTGNEAVTSTTSALYRIVAADISKATIKVDKQYYTGKPICPTKSEIVVVLNKKVLKPQDYEIVSYQNNVNKGSGKITLKGVGKYGGSKTVNFTIANKSMFYTISFRGNGATSGSMKDLQIKPGKSYKFYKNTYKKDGYVFKGWNTQPDGSGKDMNGNVILYPDEADVSAVMKGSEVGKTIILYAQWGLQSYKITYNLDGGVNHEMNPETYTSEDEIILYEPVKEGCNFLGWYTDSSFSESKRITSIVKGTTGNKVLYAKWRASMVGDVEMPEEYLNVCDFGATPNDGNDDTNSIEKAVKQASSNALSGGINTVYVPAGHYIITPGDANNDGEPGISLKSNVNLIMDKEAVLDVKATEFNSYCIISAKNVENITIKGGRIQGERYIHHGKGGEGGHGIALYGSRNITISNMSVSANWGDGIYLGTQAVRQADGSQMYVGCDNINISDCDIFDNRRSNISVTDADNLTIDHCSIFDAHGTAPQCGVNIEPNSNSSGDRICRNIVLKDTVISAYKGKNAPEYMCFMTVHNPNISQFVTADGIWFENCTFNGFVGNYSGKNLHVDEKTKFNGTFVNKK